MAMTDEQDTLRHRAGGSSGFHHESGATGSG
jgi:hypothetical protein